MQVFHSIATEPIDFDPTCPWCHERATSDDRFVLRLSETNIRYVTECCKQTVVPALHDPCEDPTGQTAVKTIMFHKTWDPITYIGRVRT